MVLWTNIFDIITTSVSSRDDTISFSFFVDRFNKAGSRVIWYMLYCTQMKILEVGADTSFCASLASSLEASSLRSLSAGSLFYSSGSPTAYSGSRNSPSDITVAATKMFVWSVRVF
jgi:hypothetical protein